MFGHDPADEGARGGVPLDIDGAELARYMDFGPAGRAGRPFLLREDELEALELFLIFRDRVAEGGGSLGDDLDDGLPLGETVFRRPKLLWRASFACKAQYPVICSVVRKAPVTQSKMTRGFL